MSQSNTYIVLTVVAVLVLAAIVVSWITKTPPRGAAQETQSPPQGGTLTGTVVATSSVQ